MRITGLFAFRECAYFIENMLIRAVPIAALISLLGSPALAAEPGVIRVAAQSDSEPKFIAQADSVTGICIDIFRAIENMEPAIRFTGEQQWMPLKRIEAMISSGKLDALCGVANTPERRAIFKVAETPLFSVSYHMLVRANDLVNVRNWDDIRKLNADGVILANAGSGPVSMLRKIGSLQIDSTAPTTSQNIDKLLAGRGRFFYYRNPGLNFEIRKSGHESKVRILAPVFDNQAFYLFLGAHVPKENEARIAQALSRLAAQGELKHIAEKWSAY